MEPDKYRFKTSEEMFTAYGWKWREITGITKENDYLLGQRFNPDADYGSVEVEDEMIIKCD